MPAHALPAALAAAAAGDPHAPAAPGLQFPTAQSPFPAQQALGLPDKHPDVYSSKCMVTPQISGLSNGDVLRALAANGFQCSAGDNTWKHLLNADSPHEMLYTNAVRALGSALPSVCMYVPTACLFRPPASCLDSATRPAGVARLPTGAAQPRPAPCTGEERVRRLRHSAAMGHG